MILECLQKGQKTSADLERELEIDKPLLLQLVKNLIDLDILYYQEEYLKINQEALKEYQSKDLAIKLEIKDLFSTLLNKAYRKEETPFPALRLKKVWLSEEEKDILSCMINNLETFLGDIEKRNQHISHRQIKEKTVILYGLSEYQDVLKESLSAS